MRKGWCKSCKEIGPVDSYFEPGTWEMVNVCPICGDCIVEDTVFVESGNEVLDKQVEAFITVYQLQSFVRALTPRNALGRLLFTIFDRFCIFMLQKLSQAMKGKGQPPLD